MTLESDEVEDGDSAGAATEDVIRAARVIRRGGVVIYPTETVYGMGSDALNQEAVARVFALKQRPANRPLFLAVSSFQMLSQVALIRPEDMAILRKLLPGPVAFLLEKRPLVPDILTAGSTLVGVRFPSHPLALSLIEETGPITSSSANLTGNPPPAITGEIDPLLARRVDMVLDGGACTYACPSTLVDLAHKRILREGAMLDRVREVLG